jgi:putative permease
MRALFQRFSKLDGARLGFFILALLGAFAVFGLVPSIFPSSLTSVLLFFIFSPIIDYFERKGISRSHGILFLLVTLGISIVFFLSWALPKVSTEIIEMKKDSARYSMTLFEKVKKHEEKLIKQIPLYKENNIAEKGIEWLQKTAQKLIEIVPSVASQFFVLLILVPFMTFVLLRDSHEIKRSLLSLVPNRYFETIYSISHRIIDEMGGYVSARLIEAFIVGLMVLVGCLITGIPYGIILGICAGATNPIPYLGPLIGAIPGLILAVTDPVVPNQVAWIVVIYVIANLIDMFVIFPVMVAKIVDLHPLLVIVSVMIGSQLFGVLGMVLAVPITSIVKILISEVYSKLYSNAQKIK